MIPKITGKYIDKMDANFPLTTKFQLKSLLKEWLKTDGKTIGNLNGNSSNPEPIIYIKIDSRKYKIHADTKREGVITFLNNEINKNPWVIIPTENIGVNTKLTNDINRNPIPGFYMYLV